MDRSLDEIISERPRGRPRPDPRPPPRRPAAAPAPPRAPRREEYPRDGVRKNRRDDNVNIDSDWVHDRYEEDRYDRDRGNLQRRPPIDDNRVPTAPRLEENGTKLRVDNLHYELTEDNLWELFERKGRVITIKMLFDRMDRPEGTAFVTYKEPRDARDALADFNGCNANGQPIKLTMLPTAPAAASKGTLFDRVERPSRSLFERIEGGADSRDVSRENVGRRRRRSESPRRNPAPENIDRYIPRGARSRSPINRRGTPREPGRRPGQRREDSGRGGGRRGKADDEGRQVVGGRPKKTAEELDAEMEDYWGSKPAGSRSNGTTAAQNGSAASAGPADDDDIDMIE